MNKKVLKLFIMMILTIMTVAAGTISKAVVENKPGGTLHTNLTISEAYNLCYNMRNKTDSSLGNNSLDPHLTTNADWAAAAYLGVSAYGSVRSKEGNAVTINEASYYSTTNNITGVMNMGTNFTQTASLMTGYKDNSYITTLKNNLNTKYVETFVTPYEDVVNNGKALGETQRWYDSTPYLLFSSNPVMVRKSIFGLGGSGFPYNADPMGGAASSLVTYRPVIWN